MAQVPATQKSSSGRLAARTEHPIQRLHQDFETLFGPLLGRMMLAPFGRDLPSMRLWDFDVTENAQEIIVRAELPGFEENELDIQVNEDVLTIKAEKQQRGDGSEEYRSFFRSVTLPRGIDADKARATYRNGLLEMHIPRTENAQTKHIKVEADQGKSNGSKNQASSTASGKAKT